MVRFAGRVCSSVRSSRDFLNDYQSHSRFRISIVSLKKLNKWSKKLSDRKYSYNSSRWPIWPTEFLLSWKRYEMFMKKYFLAKFSPNSQSQTKYLQKKFGCWPISDWLAKIISFYCESFDLFAAITFGSDLKPIFDVFVIFIPIVLNCFITVRLCFPRLISYSLNDFLIYV